MMVTRLCIATGLLMSTMAAMVASCGGGTVCSSPPEMPCRVAVSPRGTLTAVTSGDLGCYLSLKPEVGEASDQIGTFELCPGGSLDATPLVGKRVQVTTQRMNMATSSCGGDPACKMTEPTDVAVSVQALPASP